MGSNCCSIRDRNDKVVGIETRNNKFFYFNYPLLIKDIDTRLKEVMVGDADDSTGQISFADIMKSTHSP